MSVETLGITSSQLIGNPQRIQVRPDAPMEAAPKASIETQDSTVDVKRIVEDLALMAANFNRRLDFTVFEETNQVVVRVIDQATNEVIKQLPPEALLRLHARIREAVGLLFDETI